MNKKEMMLFIFLIILAAFLRFWGIIHGNFAFTFDTGRDLLAVRDLVYGHKLSLLGPTSGQMGIFYGPWWYWFLAIPFILSKGSPVFVTLFISLMGVLAVLPAYWWGKKWQDKTFGLVLAAILSFGWYFVSQTTQLWSPDLLIPLTLLVIVFLSMTESLRVWQLVLFGFLSAFLTEAEIVFGVIFSASLLLVFFIWERKFLFSRKIIPFFSGIFLVELPRIIFELRHNFLQTTSFFKLFVPNSAFVYHLDVRLGLIWEKWQAVLPFKNFYLNFIFSLLMIGLFVIAFKNTDKTRKKFLAELLFVSLFFVLFALLYPKTVWDYYLLGLPVILAILIAYAITQTIKKISAWKSVPLVIIFLFLLSRPAAVIGSLQNPDFVGNAAVFRNQLAVLDYVYQEANKNNFNYIAYTPPQIEYTWRYLFWWYGKNKYGYEPVIKRQERFYVIIEPDPGYEDRIKMWLKIRENDGKIINEYTLPSGIMVQTRERPKE